MNGTCIENQLPDFSRQDLQHCYQHTSQTKESHVQLELLNAIAMHAESMFPMYLNKAWVPVLSRRDG